MRRTLDELERLAYINGDRVFALFDALYGELDQQLESTQADLQHVEQARYEAESTVRAMQTDLDAAVHRIQHLEECLRKIAVVAGPFWG